MGRANVMCTTNPPPHKHTLEIWLMQRMKTQAQPSHVWFIRQRQNRSASSGRGPHHRAPTSPCTSVMIASSKRERASGEADNWVAQEANRFAFLFSAPSLSLSGGHEGLNRSLSGPSPGRTFLQSQPGLTRTTADANLPCLRSSPSCWLQISLRSWPAKAGEDKYPPMVGGLELSWSEDRQVAEWETPNNLCFAPSSSQSHAY